MSVRYINDVINLGILLFTILLLFEVIILAMNKFSLKHLEKKIVQRKANQNCI